MYPNRDWKKILIQQLLLAISIVIVGVLASKVLNITADYFSVTSKSTRTVQVIQVDKNQSLFGTSVAYIVDDPEGNDRISVTETDSYARYKAGDEIQLKITKYKNAPTDIDLKN